MRDVTSCTPELHSAGGALRALLQKEITAAERPWLFFSTSVRRKKSPMHILLPGQKNIVLYLLPTNLL